MASLAGLLTDATEGLWICDHSWNQEVKLLEVHKWPFIIMSSECLWDGTLSPGEFQVAAINLIDKWAMCCSTSRPWRWEPCPKLPWGASHDVKGYLSLEDFPVQSSEEHCLVEGENELEEDNEAMDPATLVQSLDNQPHVYNFHIVYNSSYRVPVLLFRGHSIDGKLLDWEDIEKDFSSCTHQLLKESKWTFLTQEEHPYLSQPWYSLHPCGTSEWMGFLFSSRRSSESSVRLFEHILVQSENSLEQGRNNGKNTTMGVNSFSKNTIETSTYSNTIRRDIVNQYLIAWLSVVGQVVGLRLPFEMSKFCS